MQPGDEPPEPFSMLTERIDNPQIQCGITRTTDGDPRDHPRQCASLADVFRADREPRAALLPVDRGQDRALRRARRAPDLPRAGRARRHHGLSERHLDLAAGGRAARAGRDHSGAGKGAAWCGPATRSNTTTSIRASCKPTLETKRVARAVPGRPDQRHDRLRRGRGAGPGRGPQRGRARQAGAARSCSTAPKAISA